MAETLETLVVKLEADMRGLSRGLERATRDTRRGTSKMQKPLDRFTRQLDGQLKGLSGAFGQLGGAMSGMGPAGLAVGAAFGAAALSLNAAMDAARQAIDQFSNLANTADKLGIGVERLQELRFAAEQVGVPAKTLDLAFQRFTRRLGEAAQGGGELKGILEQYNIAVRNADGTTRSATDVMGDLANSIKGAESEQEQLRIAFKAFDSEGAALVNMLRNGKEGMDQFSAAARDAGVVVDRHLVEKARAAGDELNRLEQQNSALLGQIGQTFTEWLLRFEELKGKLLLAVNQIIDVFREVGERSTLSLQLELDDVNSDYFKKMERLTHIREQISQFSKEEVENARAIAALAKDNTAPISATNNRVVGLVQAEADLRAEILANMAKQEELGERLAELAERRHGTAGGDAGASSLIPQGAIDKASAEIAKLQGQIDDLRRTDLGRDTFASFRSADVIDDEGNVKPGMEEQASTIVELQRLIDEMERSNEVAARATAITMALQTEQQKQAAEMAELNELYQAGALTLEEYQAAQEGVRDKYDSMGRAAKRVIESIKTDQEKLAEEIEKLNELLREGKLTTEEHARAVEKAQKKYDDATDSLEEMARQGVDGLADSFRDLALGTKDAGDVILDVLFRIGDALADVLSQEAIKGLGLSGGGSGGGGGAATGTLVSGIGNFLGGLLGFADGGNPPIGVPSIVGERGPEIIVPRMPTTVIPNHAIGGMRGGGGGGGGSPVVINHNVTIDARGADPAQLRRVEGALLEMNRTFDDRAVGAVNQGVRRGRLNLS